MAELARRGDTTRSRLLRDLGPRDGRDGCEPASCHRLVPERLPQQLHAPRGRYAGLIPRFVEVAPERPRRNVRQGEAWEEVMSRLVVVLIAMLIFAPAWAEEVLLH